MDDIIYKGRTLKPVKHLGGWVVKIIETGQMTMPFTEPEPAIRDAKLIVDQSHGASANG